jgi:type I site-specific restriction-modification system R (restriction) subunit
MGVPPVRKQHGRDGHATDEDESTEDSILRIMEARKMLANASYFAFTPTPKNRTLEMIWVKPADGPYQAIVAFSGEHSFGGAEKVIEAKMNGFPSAQIPDRLREDPYRFLIAAEKFQTGFDEPLLHTMYVDKVLSGARPRRRYRG